MSDRQIYNKKQTWNLNERVRHMGNSIFTTKSLLKSSCVFWPPGATAGLTLQWSTLSPSHSDGLQHRLPDYIEKGVCSALDSKLGLHQD